MNNIFQELQKRGYQVYHKRILGNPQYTSEETRRKDLIQELALVVEFIRINNNYFCEPMLVSGNKYTWCVYKEVKGIYGSERAEGLSNYEALEYLTPQEATIAAIEYLIENKLI